QQEADETEASDLAAAERLRGRARRLYLRAKNYGLRGLEVNYPGVTNALSANPKAALKKIMKTDVSLLYWTAAAWGSAISLSKDVPELVGQIPAMEALIDRALELEAGYGNGAIHSFLIAYEMSRQGLKSDPAERARKEFGQAVAASKGQEAAPFVALAEAVTIQKQDAKEFESLLNRALAINPDSNPETRLVNTVMQKRARWLLSRKADLFLE
ncbi:MAG: TRAP transporter TatT component family protein, partial [Verrucomicrobiota bacterium]